MLRTILLLLLPVLSSAQNLYQPNVSRWEAQASRVTIVEDDWGVPHIKGISDADVVFGLMYVQCSQNFERVEKNYLEVMGRMAEVEGVGRLYEDLQMRLIYDSSAAIADYNKSPEWFKKLLLAFADGVNFYLYKHPEVKPLALTRFQPWFPLLYTDGSIAPTQTGGLSVADLRNFYENKNEITSYQPGGISMMAFNPGGSNGFAIGPSKSATKNAMLYINPHVTFYFRGEVHLSSNEGLNAYGAVTWGQFFIYQGFNEHCGWMHTSSYADVADVYEEQIEKTANGYQYFYTGNKGIPVANEKNKRQVVTKSISINYKDGDKLLSKTFPVYFTHHGPVMGARQNKWLTLKENNRSLSSLLQSWLRTKATGFAAFKNIMNMRANNSNNTVFADDKGHIAYWHGNYIPKRNAKYNWRHPVDGTTPATEWQGLHALEETVHIYNPSSGWIQNCNSSPFTASGSSSPNRKKYADYLAPDGENGRAVNAIRLLSKPGLITLDQLIAVGYNRYLSAFDILLPPLLDAYAAIPVSDSLNQILAAPIQQLQSWDKQAAASSIATTLAVEWAAKLSTKVPPAPSREDATNAVANFTYMANNITGSEKLQMLKQTIDDLIKDFGTWQVAWGDINRYQRLPGNQFSDAAASLPVGLGPATWGSLPSFISRQFYTKKKYGFSGNSFIAAVEFGKKLKAKTIITGGASFNATSPHYSNQAEGFIEGKFKDIYFYPADVQKHAVRTYHPGQ